MLFYQNVKRRSAEALLENTATKEKLLAKDREALKHEATLELEDKLRANVEAERKRKDDKDPSVEELTDFFNRPPSN